MLRRNITIVNIKKKKVHYNCGNESFRESLLKFMGQTITIFTVSGGKSGEGFTGVLLNISSDHIELLTKLESAPVISFESKDLEDEKNNVCLGSIINIPLDKIAAFIHNII